MATTVEWRCQECNFGWVATLQAQNCPRCQSKNTAFDSSYKVDTMTQEATVGEPNAAMECFFHGHGLQVYHELDGSTTFQSRTTGAKWRFSHG